MSILADSLVDRVGGIIPRYNMFSVGDRIGVGVSGGADSVVLLHILHRFAARLQIKLLILHVNHHLRGSESDADEEFVRALAGSLGIEIFVQQAGLANGNLEQAAREARLEFLQSCMQQHDLRRVALGHTRSDQAETVLFRFLRGSGLAGLAGMRMVSKEGLIRPLLTTSREEVREWAAAEGISWREDSSNADLHFARNRLRLRTIPMLVQEFNPNLETTLARTAVLAQSEEEYWFEQIEPIYAEITKRTHLGSILHIPALRALHLAFQRRLIRRGLIDIKGDLRSIDMEHVEAILSLCSSTEGHARVIVPGVDALRSFDKLLLTRPGELKSHGRHYVLEVEVGRVCELPFRAGYIYADWVKRSDAFCANFEERQEFVTEVVDLDATALSGQGSDLFLYVRNWQPGDQLQRPGHQGAEKIKSLFQEYRVLLWERRHWPVVVSGGEIVWARQFGSSAKFRASGESGETLRLIYRMADE